MPAAEIPARPEPPLTIAVSDCLTGREVRFDGSHKRSSLCHEQLDGVFELRGYCPEVAIGMTVPREPIRLVGSRDAPRAVGVKDAGVDVTEALTRYGSDIATEITGIDGYIFMKGSPSCGLFRVKVYPEAGAMPDYTGRGVYAHAITSELPNLPVEESGRLNDAVLRENFMTRTFAHAHWRALAAFGLTPARLIAFHSQYKYLVMAHSVSGYQRLGRLLANLASGFDEICQHYFAGLMAALAIPATRRGHANVLAHLQGYVKRDIPSAARQELDAVIQSYRRGEVPLLAPMTLLKHHLGTHEARYALDQIYLNPHPTTAGFRREL